MTIDIIYKDKKTLYLKYREIIKDVIIRCLNFEKCPYEVEISVTLVSEEEISCINKEFRNIDKSTDVLSFPQNEFVSPALFDDEFENNAVFNPETGELVLGDIIISVNHIINQAKEYGHGKKRELAFLVTHSMLHLMGYDHIEEKDRLLMEERQRIILDDSEYSR